MLSQNCSSKGCSLKTYIPQHFFKNYSLKKYISKNCSLKKNISKTMFPKTFLKNCSLKIELAKPGNQNFTFVVSWERTFKA